MVYSGKLKVKDNDIQKNLRMYACDFETTTGAVSTEWTRVWSFCADEIGKYDPEIYGSIEEFFDWCADVDKGTRKRLYFHNLKFDGNFIMWHLQNVLGFETRISAKTGSMEKPENLINGEMSYIINDTGKWYYLAFKYKNILVECRDSLKLLPFTLAEVGKGFCKKYKKSTMEYDDKSSLGGCSPEDIEYIKNDVLVLSEALSFIMKLNGEESPFDPIRSLTIGGACYQEFKKSIYGDKKLVEIKLNETILPEECRYLDMDSYIRSGYRGGYCYVNPVFQGKILDQKGFTADVNSLYPYAMTTAYSGNWFPFGKGKYCKGRPTDKEISDIHYYFYMRINVSFELRPGYVPTIQKKNSFLYVQNTYLESSRIMNYATGTYIGDPQMVELTLSKDDWILFERHYRILKIEYLDYIVFGTIAQLFDFYIEKYAQIKRESSGPVRSLSKLFQNDLYGQMSKSDNSTFKVVLTDRNEDGGLKFEDIEAHEKKPVNIAIGACITAKARYHQITTIQNNLERFCYSDTDSLHCIGDPEDFVGEIDDRKYGAYKIEGIWTRARFVRQKTYIEELEIPENQKKYCNHCNNHCNWNICSAGMTPDQKEYFRNHHQFEDFAVGLQIPGGKLKPRQIPGGVILEEVGFTIK